MRILLLGAYGLIGSEIAHILLQSGHTVVGFGRDAAKGRSRFPAITWHQADIATLLQPSDWLAYLKDIDVIINASGALQTGLRDNLEHVQNKAICALITAAEQQQKPAFIQISAPGAAPDAQTEFLRTKGLADAALRASSLRWLLFKPGLVISANTYGGTTLLRMLAALPFPVPLCNAQSQIQTVAARDVAEAVSLALTRPTLWQKDYDLVAPEVHSLRALVQAFRAWLGFKAQVQVVHMPAGICTLIARGADLLGWLGWRSPLRTTSMRVLTAGVHGASTHWQNASGQQLMSLAQTLATLPATQQERSFARLALLFPIGVFILVGFWFYSGLIGLLELEVAARYLNAPYAKALVTLFSYIDIIIAGLLAFRASFKTGIALSLIVATGYLLGGTLLTPELWTDPLGPLAKIFPVLMLTLFVRAGLQER